MEIWILVAAVLVPVLVTIFGDDLRKLRRVLTFAFDFFRRNRRKAYKWYARCEEHDFVAKLVNDPAETTPVFIKSLLDSEKREYWPTQISSGDAFMLGVIWRYRGFWASLGHHPFEDGDFWTWAVVAPPAFLSVSGRASISRHVSRFESHWTGSAVIDAATAYIDDQIKESGVADYRPPRRFRVLRWLRNPTLKQKVQSLQQTA